MLETILALTTSILGILFLTSEILGKSKCDINSVADVIERIIKAFKRKPKCKRQHSDVSSE